MTIYDSRSVLAAAATERRRLRAHQADPHTGLCYACGRPAPCPDSRGAVDFLVERQLPLVDGRDHGQVRSLLQYARRRRHRPADRGREPAGA
jgi:hypothetical protein